MIYTIKNDKLSVKINSFGAEMVSVIKDGKERLWQNEDGSWDGHAITLFPFCSWVKVWVDGKFYPNGIHGFGKDSEFTLLSQTSESLTLRLCENEETKTHYPYDFVLDISFELNDNSVKISHRVYNPMEITLPYSCGSHESYAIDAPIDEYYVEFEKQEHFKNKSAAFRDTEIGYDDMGKSNILSLKNEYFKDDASLVFLDMNSRWIKLCKKDGTVIAKVSYDKMFCDLVFWKTESGSYICMEPWMSVCDMGNETMEFSEKRGIFSLSPKCEETRTHTVTYY